jgi:microcystin-dependent protein
VSVRSSPSDLISRLWGWALCQGQLLPISEYSTLFQRPAYGDKGLNPRDPNARVTMQRKMVYFGLQGASGGGREQRLCAAGRDDRGQCP